MATRFMNELLAGLEGEPTFQARPWYNRYGDCVVFHASDAPEYADRIDGILTLYRSIEDDSVIGFQIKGVQAIIELSGSDGMTIQARTDEGKVQKVAVSLLLVVAAFQGGKEASRRRAYAEATSLAAAEFVELPSKAA